MADLQLTDKEKRVLAYTLLGEAGGEGRDGMAAVMNVILNRSRSGRYPSNPAAVATQANSKGVHQFSTWNKKGDGGNSPDTTFSLDSQQYREALDIVQSAMAGELPDTTGGATHFVTKKMFEDAKPNWWAAEAPAGEVTIGNHVFGARNPNAALSAINTATGGLKKGGEAVSAYATKGLSATVPDAVTGVPRPTGELSSRSVTTVRVDPVTGEVYTPSEDPNRLKPDASTSDPQMPGSKPVARQPDLRGTAALSPTASGNLQSLGKQDRARTRPADTVAEAARTGTGNAASATKQDRARPTPAPQAAPAVQGQNLTAAQVGQQADNARMSGYRDIQEMGPSSKGAVSKPVTRFATPGVVKTANGISGTTQLPRSVTPQVIVKPATPAAAIADAGKPRSTVLPAPPVTKPANDALRLSQQVPSSQLQLEVANTSTAVPTGGNRRGRAKPADVASARKTPEKAQLTTDVTRPPLSEGQLAVVARNNIVAARTKAQTQKITGWGGGAGLPAPMPVAATVARQAVARPAPASAITGIGGGGAFSSGTSGYLSETFGDNALLPASMNTKNWTDPYNGGMNSGSTNPRWW